MARQKRDTEAHRKAAEKMMFETELCGDLVNKYLTNIPEGRRADVRLALEHVIVDLDNVWCKADQELRNEWKRNRRALHRLLGSAFDRWTDAAFVRPLVLHQLATNPKNTPKKMTDYLNDKRVGISEPPKTGQQTTSRRNADRQELSRGSRPFRTQR
jgi:hypothetical protein